MSRDRSFGIETRVRAELPRNKGSLPGQGEENIISSTAFGPALVHIAFFIMDAKGSSLGGKAPGASS
jgi:hypothetical protein